MVNREWVVVELLLLGLVCVLCAPSPSPSPSSSSLSSTPPECFPVDLDNECGNIFWLANTTSPYPPVVQELIFGAISLEVSNIRMLPFNCRRPLLWYGCLQAFAGGCETDGEGCEVGEEGFYRSLCEEIKENCPGVEFDCDRGKRCLDEVDSALTSPIPVQTCLSSNTTTAECCFSPYDLASDTEECTLICPYYPGFSNSDYEIISYVMLGLVCVGIIVVISGVLPLFFMEGALIYPRYYLPFGLMAAEAFLISYIFAYLLGNDHICGGEKNTLIALPDYLDSAGCQVQGFFYTFFLFLMGYCHLMLSLVVLASVLRNTTFLNPFRENQETKKYEYFFNICGVSVALIMAGTAVGLSVGRGGDDSFYFVLANACVLSYIGNQEILWHLFFSYCGATLLCFVYLIFSIIRMDWRILLLQGRSVFVLVYYITIVIFAATLTYMWDILSDLSEPECVALSPPEDPGDDCDSDTNVVYIAFVICYISAYPIGVSIVSFLSTSLVYGWWRDLIIKREANSKRLSQKMGRSQLSF